MEPRYYISGAVGPFIDERPILTHANIKPYIVAILLHRGAVSFQEVITALTPHCSDIDLKVGMWDEVENYEIEDRTRLEVLTEEVLGEMVSSKILRYNESRDLWVLSVGKNQSNLPKIINWVAATGAQIPHHILLDMSRDQILKSQKINARFSDDRKP